MTVTSYRDVIEEAVRAEMDVIGEGMAVNVCRRVDGVQVADDGTVEEVAGDGRDVLDRLVGMYIHDFGEVSASLIARRIHRELDLGDVDLPPALATRVATLERRSGSETDGRTGTVRV